MFIFRYCVGIFFVVLSFLGTSSWAQDPQLDQGREAIQKMTGCYLIDYSYIETESLKPGYIRDSRVYDVNKDKSVKEWIYAEDISSKRIRLQHILFMSDLAGKSIPANMLKHQSEDWEYDAPFLYEFTAPLTWMIKDLKATPEQWTRRITNLDDGLRYQCASTWNLKTVYPEWSCENYAPIPGRETRDMGRKDYNTLQRSTRLVIYGSSWLERQENTKVIYQSGRKASLAKEFGKNWYIRLPDSECREAQEFVQPRLAFWSILRETWDEILNGSRPFIEKSIPLEAPRFVKLSEIEETYLSKDLSNPEIRKAAKSAILDVIEAYRANK